MNRLSNRQLLPDLAIGPILAMALLISNTIFGLELTLPEEMNIQVDGRQVKGFQGDPDYIRKLAADIVANPSSEKAKNFPAEGFVYRGNFGTEDGFDVVAWSSKGQMNDILMRASRTLTGMVEEQNAGPDKPAGYINSAIARNDYGKATVKRAAPSIKQPKIAAPQWLAKIQPSGDKLSLAPVTASIAGAELNTSPATELAKGFDWKLFLILLAIVVVLLVCTRLAFVIKV